jgi:hypothetical protein
VARRSTPPACRCVVRASCSSALAARRVAKLSRSPEVILGEPGQDAVVRLRHVQRAGPAPAHLCVAAGRHRRRPPDTPDLFAAWRLGARQTTPRPTTSPLVEPISADIRPLALERDTQPTSASRPIVRPHPNLLAAWRLGARQTTPRRPPPLEEPIGADTRTGRAKPPSRQELNSDPHVEDIQTVGLGAGRPAHLCVAADRPTTPPTSWRLGGLARDKRRRDDHRLSKSRSPTPGQVAPSRQAAKSSTQPQSSAHIQTVGLGAGHPAHLRVAADRRHTPNLLAAWRLGARQTTPRRPPPSRRADRADARTGRAKPPSRQELGSDPHVEDIQTVGLGAGRPAHLCVAAIVRPTPNLLAAWRLGARQTTPRRPPPARRADRRRHPDRSRKAAKAPRARRRPPRRGPVARGGRGVGAEPARALSRRTRRGDLARRM